MPMILRVTEDMFEFSEVTSLMTNPVNLVGASGKGLALEFRKRVPSFIEEYQLACRNKDLRIGTVQIIGDTGFCWDLLNFPTKRHYVNDSRPEDIARGLEALRNKLSEPLYRYSVLGMPMLGCGCGMQDYEIVFPMMKDNLSDLDATVFLSMSPRRTEIRPKYLVVVGPVDYGRDEKEKAAIAWGIQKAMEAWGTSLTEYTDIVSGGYPGVDEFIGGTDFNKKVEDTFVFQKTGKTPLVCKPNTERNGVAANLMLGNLLSEIGDDIILFKPKGHNNNRMSAMQTWLTANKEQRIREGLIPRRVAIFGDVGTDNQNTNILVPQIHDIPY